MSDQPKAFFVFREKNGKLRCLSWKRYIINKAEVIHWADTQKEGREYIRRLKRDSGYPSLFDNHQAPKTENHSHPQDSLDSRTAAV